MTDQPAPRTGQKYPRKTDLGLEIDAMLRGDEVTEPRTAAGRSAVFSLSTPPFSIRPDAITKIVLAIEAEAEAAQPQPSAGLRAALTELLLPGAWQPYDDNMQVTIVSNEHMERLRAALEVTENIENNWGRPRKHMTDGSPCWCKPTILHPPDYIAPIEQAGPPANASAPNVSDASSGPPVPPDYAPDMDFDEVTENIEAGWGRREHLTDGTPCRCDPIVVKPANDAAPLSRYELLCDNERFGLHKGDVLICEPMHLAWANEKVAVMYRESDGYEPGCSQYRSNVRHLSGPQS